MNGRLPGKTPLVTAATHVPIVVSNYTPQIVRSDNAGAGGPAK